jgi:DNA-binding LacI/PurR family transcriptional regulator
LRVSIKDVAVRANVSRGTVSHVLNNRSGARISRETQERVRQAAFDLGYIPNEMARSLFRGRTRLIGLLTSGIGNPFFSELIGECETAIAEGGYRRLVDASFPYVAKARPELLSVWPVDGILMHAAIGRISEGILGPRVAHVPVLYLDSPADSMRDTVQFDLRPGMIDAAESLLAKSHVHIGIVSPYDQFDWVTKQRNQPLVEACQGLRRSFSYYKLDEDSQPSAYELGQRIGSLPAERRPTALFCYSDHLAIGIYHGLLRAGARIPDDIAVVGEGGIEGGLCLDRPLSTIKYPVADLCRIGVRMLRERIEGLVDCPPRHILLPTEFIQRETT